jgi:hypothetical protein
MVGDSYQAYYSNVIIEWMGTWFSIEW